MRRHFVAAAAPCWFHLLVAMGSCMGCLGFGGVSTAQDDARPLKQPKLLARLPEICPTPDGLAIDADGNVIVACPNFGDKTHPAVLMKIDPENRVRLFATVPVHPETGTASPMGLDFGPDGDLFIVDNQGWAKPNDHGRILRMEIRDEINCSTWQQEQRTASLLT